MMILALADFLGKEQLHPAEFAIIKNTVFVIPFELE